MGMDFFDRQSSDDAHYDPMNSRYEPFESMSETYFPYENRGYTTPMTSKPFITSGGVISETSTALPQAKPQQEQIVPTEQRQINEQTAQVTSQTANQAKKLGIGVGVLFIIGIVIFLVMMKRKV